KALDVMTDRQKPSPSGIAVASPSPPAVVACLLSPWLVSPARGKACPVQPDSFLQPRFNFFRSHPAVPIFFGAVFIKFYNIVPTGPDKHIISRDHWESTQLNKSCFCFRCADLFVFELGISFLVLF